MTELYIDGQPVALPEDFSFELVRENPFFTKGGAFTFDISLNLDIPVNAKLYKHINRFNSSSLFQNRSARLIVDGRTILNGTEIILEINELSVSIQLASGNSELNFLVGGDRTLSSLDLGKCETPSAEEALKSWELTYPECNYVCAPVKTEGSQLGTILLNNLSDYHIKFFDEAVPSMGLRGFESENIRAMPYLNFIVEKVIMSLGYFIKQNDLVSTEYNRLYIVHGSNPSTWNELLPDMTINEFLTEIEELFDVKILVNEKNKEVQILFSFNYYETANIFYPQYVSEQFERKILSPDEKPLFNKDSSIRYNLPDKTYYKYQDLDIEVVDSLKRKEFENHQDLVTWISTLENEKSWAGYLNYLLNVNDTGYHYVLVKAPVEQQKDYELRQCNILGHILQEGANEIELDIFPAEIDAMLANCEIYSFNPTTGEDQVISSYFSYLFVPIAEKIVEPEDGVLSAQDRIEGKENEKKSISKIAVAFWCGVKTAYAHHFDDYPSQGKKYYPMSTTHYLLPFTPKKKWVVDETYATLSLTDKEHGLYDKIYNRNVIVNPDEEFTIHGILGENIPTPIDIFYVQGRKFLCKDIKLKITPDGLDPEYQATLYALI